MALALAHLMFAHQTVASWAASIFFAVTAAALFLALLASDARSRMYRLAMGLIFLLDWLLLLALIGIAAGVK